jgi:hypothetical protein
MKHISILNKTNNLLITITTFLLLIGCSKSPDPDPGCVENLMGTIRLTEKEKSIHPYNIGDTIVFYNDSLNSLITYTCTEQPSTFHPLSENSPGSSGYNGCLGNYYNSEIFATLFNSNLLNTRSRISIFAQTKNPFDTIYNINLLNISIKIPVDSIYPFSGFYCFSEDTLFNYPLIVRGYVEDFYDTIMLDGKIHQNIYLLAGEKGMPQYERINKILFSISEGIIRFSTNRNNVWNLR